MTDFRMHEEIRNQDKKKISIFHLAETLDLKLFREAKLRSYDNCF